MASFYTYYCLALLICSIHSNLCNEFNCLKYLSLFEGTAHTALKILKSLNALLVSLTLISILSFYIFILPSFSKSPKFFHNLILKSPLHLLKTLNYFFRKILFRLRIFVEHEHCRKVKNEAPPSLLIASFFLSLYRSTKAILASSPIISSHLNVHEAFYILKSSKTLVNDFSSLPSTPVNGSFKLFFTGFNFLCIYLFYLRSVYMHAYC